MMLQGVGSGGSILRWAPASVQVVSDLADLVRDLAKALAER